MQATPARGITAADPSFFPFFGGLSSFPTARAPPHKPPFQLLPLHITYYILHTTYVGIDISYVETSSNFLSGVPSIPFPFLDRLPHHADRLLPPFSISPFPQLYPTPPPRAAPIHPITIAPPFSKNKTHPAKSTYGFEQYDFKK